MTCSAGSRSFHFETAQGVSPRSRATALGPPIESMAIETEDEVASMRLCCYNKSQNTRPKVSSTRYRRSDRLLLPMVASGDKGKECKYPGLRDAIARYRKDGGTRAAIAQALGVHISMIARYERGDDMPRPKKLEKLATLVNVPASVIRGEARLDKPMPGVAIMQLADVTPDEQIVLEGYRKLPPHGQESLRVHLTRLLQQFSQPSTTYPFLHNQ